MQVKKIATFSPAKYVTLVSLKSKFLPDMPSEGRLNPTLGLDEAK
jgi:hypothetical protein